VGVTKVKVLVLTPEPIYPVKTGLHLRAYNLIKPLADKHDFTLVHFKSDNNQLADLDGVDADIFSKTISVPLEAGPDRSGLISDIYETFFPSELSFGPVSNSANMRNALQAELKNDDYDIVFIISSRMFNYNNIIDGIPVVFDSIDNPCILYFRAIKNKFGLINKLKAYKLWMRVKNMVVKYYSNLQHIIFSSEVDAQAAYSYCKKTKVYVVTNGIETINTFSEIRGKICWVKYLAAVTLGP
jgi:hypothetical protein